LTFQNWGRTVKNTPTVTYYPETVAEIIDILRDAVAKNKGIRVAGFRKLLILPSTLSADRIQGIHGPLFSGGVIKLASLPMAMY
jgi:hypothetical protein